MNSCLNNIPKTSWYNPGGYQSNIDLSGDAPLAMGVTNLCDEPVLGKYGQNTCLSPTGNVPKSALIDGVYTHKHSFVTGALKKSFI